MLLRDGSVPAARRSGRSWPKRVDKPPAIRTLDDYQAAMTQCYLFLSALETLPLEELADKQEHADAIGPFIDPTLFLANATKLREDMGVVKLLLETRRQWLALVAKLR